MCLLLPTPLANEYSHSRSFKRLKSAGIATKLLFCNYITGYLSFASVFFIIIIFNLILLLLLSRLTCSSNSRISLVSWQSLWLKGSEHWRCVAQNTGQNRSTQNLYHSRKAEESLCFQFRYKNPQRSFPSFFHASCQIQLTHHQWWNHYMNEPG